MFDIFIKLSDILALNAIAIGDLMGAINKGENISLQNLINDVFIVGVGWKSEAAQIDIDVSAFLINEQGKVTNDEDFIFYNKLIFVISTSVLV